MKRRKPLKSRETLKSFKALNRVSKKLKAELDVYSKLRVQFLARHPLCEICGNVPPNQIHHKARRGPNLNRTETWMALCFDCHRKVESNGKWAREMGYITV